MALALLQVWTNHESAARELMHLELEDVRQQVDKMSDEELAQLAMRMMAVSAGCWTGTPSYGVVASLSCMLQ